MKKILRIVITGGPCAGKTTALTEIKKMLEDDGYQVIILNETATQMIESNLIPGKTIDLRSFQKLILDMQLAKEKIFLEAANNPIAKDKVAIIYDRGIFDNRAYIPHEIFKEFIDDIGLTEHDILDRYDLIIHMVSTAYDKPAVYTTEINENAERFEKDIPTALKVEKNTLLAWPNTNKKHVVYNEGTLENKIERVKTIIKDYINSQKSNTRPNTRKRTK